MSKIIGRECVAADFKRADLLRHAMEYRIRRAMDNCSLYFFRPQRELVVISGAGIVGLAASFQLLARGFKVVIAEKRESFSRSNIINLNVETQHFLEEHGLLKEFEASVAGRIHHHRYMHVAEKSARQFALSDVSQLQRGNGSFEPENFNKLFTDDGIYSVKIQDLQTFLAKRAIEAGARLFGNVEVEVLNSKAANVRLIGDLSTMILRPQLFFVAEGAHSTTAERLGMKAAAVKSACTGENWIFGNAKYSGKETFVVSIVNTSKQKLEIANVIFNAKLQEVNIAVSSKRSLSQAHIQERILKTLRLALRLENRDEAPLSLTTTVKHPVHVNNEKRLQFSRDHTFLIGDAVLSSSPLAGLGGTLGLTLIPRTIKQLLDDREQRPDQMHANFQKFSEAYTSRWIEKSSQVKEFCLDLFKKESQHEH